MTMLLADLLNVYRTNFRLKTVKEADVLGPLEGAHAIVSAFAKQRDAIAKNPNMTNIGRLAAVSELAAKAKAEVRAWAEPRLKVLDAQVSQQRGRLTPAPKLDAAKVAAMATHLQKYSPFDVNVLYGSASPEEKQLIEAASQLTGRIPVKSTNGELTWEPLLDPAVVDEAQLSRADPEAKAKYSELQEIAAMTRTVAGQAEREIAPGATQATVLTSA